MGYIYTSCIVFWLLGMMLEAIDILPFLEWSGRMPNLKTANDYLLGDSQCSALLVLWVFFVDGPLLTMNWV